MTKKEALTAPAVAYWSGLNGVEIKAIEYGIDDHIMCVSGAWSGKRKAHRLKVRYTKKGVGYMLLHGYRIRLDECIRV